MSKSHLSPFLRQRLIDLWKILKQRQKLKKSPKRRNKNEFQHEQWRKPGAECCRATCWPNPGADKKTPGSIFFNLFSSMLLCVFFVVEKNKPLYDNDWVLPSQIYPKEAFWSIPLLDYLLGLPPVVQFFAILFHLFWPMILHVSMFFFYYWILEIEQLFSMRKSSTSDPSTKKINSHISATATFFLQILWLLIFFHCLFRYRSPPFLSGYRFWFLGSWLILELLFFLFVTLYIYFPLLS